MQNEDRIRHIADLARIRFTDAEIKKFAQEFSAILEFIGKLNELSVEGVEPIAHITGRENASRSDTEGNDGGAVLQNTAEDLLEEQAPGYRDGEIRVPRILS